MMSAKKAKEYVIKSISKRKYIKDAEKAVKRAIESCKFTCDIEISEYNDIDISVFNTAVLILKYFGYYGYDGYIRESNEHKASICIKWGDS